jgi:16S rRNA G1207 methylase RsmC
LGSDVDAAAGASQGRNGIQTLLAQEAVAELLAAYLAAELEAEGIYSRVYNQDFLTFSPDVTGLYDRVVMNPPFDRERDIDHVLHALKFLKEDGFLTAIVSAGTEFRETKKATAFREHMKKLNAR